MENSIKEINSPKHLGWILGIPIADIDHVIQDIDKYYRSWDKLKRNPDGSPKIVNGEKKYRPINESLSSLKTIQSRLNDRILKYIPLPKNVLGGVKTYSTKHNAKLHKGNKFKFCTDIYNYFPSISHIRVYDLFISLGHSPDVSRILTKITTQDGKLPQGTPTSTSLANLVFRDIDQELLEYCSSNSIIYSRWVDDIVLSSKSDFKNKLSVIINIISKSGFKIHNRKTYYKIGPAIVTGIIVKNNTLLIPDVTYDKLSNPKISESSKEGLVGYVKYVQS